MRQDIDLKLQLITLVVGKRGNVFSDVVNKWYFKALFMYLNSDLSLGPVLAHGKGREVIAWGQLFLFKQKLNCSRNFCGGLEEWWIKVHYQKNTTFPIVLPRHFSITLFGLFIEHPLISQKLFPGTSIVAEWIEPVLCCWHPNLECLFELWLGCFQSIYLLMYMGRQWKTVQVLGPLTCMQQVDPSSWAPDMHMVGKIEPLAPHFVLVET